jgi:hypothetical protein
LETESSMKSLRVLFAFAISGLLLAACASMPKAKPGLYVNQEHRFSVDYPASWQGQPLQGDEVLRAANPTQFKLPVVTAAVAPQRQEASLDPKAFMAVMQQRIAGSSDFKLLSEENITLNDSTPGKAFTFEWLWADKTTRLTTATLIAIKNGRYYNATATNISGGSPPADQLLAIVKSWKFY